MLAMNVPYVKKYDANGNITNPIVETIVNEFDNRSERRKNKTKVPFFGNGKNTPLTVTKTGKYLRQRQFIKCRDKKGGEFTGEIRVVEHYILK